MSESIRGDSVPRSLPARDDRVLVQAISEENKLLLKKGKCLGITSDGKIGVLIRTPEGNLIVFVASDQVLRLESVKG